MDKQSSSCFSEKQAKKLYIALLMQVNIGIQKPNSISPGTMFYIP
jgi:hypothetical protein